MEKTRSESSRLKRLKEALSIWIHLNIVVALRIITFFLILHCLFLGGFARYLLAAYAIWVFWDRNTPRTGGRSWQWIRKGSLLRHSADYFPIKCINLTEIPADKNYLAISHPHGVIPFGSSIMFGTDLFCFYERFGLRLTFCTLNFNFLFPIAREYILGAGVISADSFSIRYKLESSGVGNVVCITVGGSEEANYNRAGVYEIVLNNRKGFCRVALQTGAHLIPTFSFGEVDNLEIIKFENNVVLKFCRMLTGINFMAFRGVPSWLPILGLPKKRPINIIMGKPIPVERKVNPTPDDVNNLHAVYVSRIKALFDSEKHKYLEDPDTELIIV